ncbi:MAG: S41 family peptidase [Lachnospiraceae bacterium]|nr:S41 family peptidase [Lachnospiraceae bacterium]
MTNKDKIKYFASGILVATLWFLVIGGICLLISSGVIGGKKDTGDGGAVTEANIEKIEHFQRLLETYYYEDVPKEDLADGVLYGLMETVGDPYTCYYSVEEMEELTADIEGIFHGIGAYLEMDYDKGYAKISGIIDGTPASESDIQVGDYVVEVDGTDTYEMTLTDVVAMIRGDEGTKVTLTLNRNGQEVEVTVTRQNIETPTVKYELLENDIAYITVTEFDDVTTSQFVEALAQMDLDNAKGLILDLRGNPGGNLSTVVEMCELMLPEGMIVYTEDKYGVRNEYECDGKHKFDLPLVVLIDGASASASEIMAGAIKDYELGTLVGTTTYGKGIVQKIFAYDDGSAAKITVSKYYTPNGYNIHGVGIEPDVVVEFDADLYLEDKTDNQLEKAIEVITEEING